MFIFKYFELYLLFNFEEKWSLCRFILDGNLISKNDVSFNGVYLSWFGFGRLSHL